MSQNPGPTQTEIQVLAALFSDNRMAEAESTARRMIQTWPETGIGWKALGTALDTLRRPAEALPVLQRALVFLPSDPETHNTMGNTLLAMGRVSESEDAFRRALSLNADYGEAHNNLGNVLKESGRLTDAETSYRRALQLKPGMHEAHSNLGNVLKELGRLSEAETCCRRALELRPDFHQAHNNLGSVLQALGRLPEAEACYRRAIEISPNSHLAHNNLGSLLKDRGRLAEAETCFRHALQLKPDYHEAHSNLGNTLQGLGRLAEAEASYRRALELKPDFAIAHGNLGITLQALGRLPEADKSYRRALEIEPDFSKAIDLHVGVLNVQSNVLGRIVPEWHIPMINDSERNEAYLAALRSAVTPESRVLEIGTGSGLLALMAARLGALQVVTCEAVPLIAATAQEIVSANGYASSIRVISKNSSDLEVGIDLQQRADLLVSEVFSSELLGEGVLLAIEDAKRRLLEPGARIIPAAGSVVCALFGGDEIGKNIAIGRVCGFDLEKFNAIASRKRYIHRSDLGVDLFTDDVEAFEFDFTRHDYFPPDRKTLRLPIKVAGRCHGVVQWIRLRMDDSVTFENHPSAKTPASGWQQCLYRFPEPIDVVPGQVARICAAHNRVSVWFFLEELENSTTDDKARASS